MFFSRASDCGNACETRVASPAEMALGGWAAGRLGGSHRDQGGKKVEGVVRTSSRI